jgi:RNA polymerase sigma-54 factor
MYLSPYLEPQTTVSPQMVLASEILQLSATDLEQRIHQELTENPALEIVESSHCIRCGMPVVEGRWLCHQCAQQPGEGNGQSEQQQDVGAWAPARVTLKQHLWTQLRLSLPSSLHSLAELVIGYLDEHGFLVISAEELARQHGVPRDSIAQVIDTLHQVEPVGMGAANVREALLIQIAYLSRLEEAPHLSLAQKRRESVARDRPSTRGHGG